MFVNPVSATWQAHCMQQDILPEGTKAQFLSVGNALGYGGQVFSDFKVFAIHLPFNHCSTWIHLVLATPKYLMALAQATGTQPSLTLTSFFVFLPTQLMHCFSELMKQATFQGNPGLFSFQTGQIQGCCLHQQGWSTGWIPVARIANKIYNLQPANLYPPFGTRFP